MKEIPKKYVNSLNTLDQFLQENYDYIPNVDEMMTTLEKIHEELMKVYVEGMTQL